MTIRLHAFPLSPRSFKVLFAAHQIDVDYELVPIDFVAGDTRTARFIQMNPNQRVPVLEHDGYSLWESNAIVQYLAALKPQRGYLPMEVRERMTAVKWQFWESGHWDPACAVFMFQRFVKPKFGLGDVDPVEIKRGEQDMARLAPVLDAQLTRERYIAGERMTVADLSLAPTLCSWEQVQMPLGHYPGIQRWLGEFRALPAWKRTEDLQKSKAA
jgi:glutathione S-transferase